MENLAFEPILFMLLAVVLLIFGIAYLVNIFSKFLGLNLSIKIRLIFSISIAVSLIIASVFTSKRDSLLERPTQNPPPPDSTYYPYWYYVDHILASMVLGNISFNVPDSIMDLNESFTIQLLLDLSKPARDLEKRIKESGIIESHQIKIWETMQARLTGSGFQITTITPEEQPISTKETTEWKWDIKAIEHGRQRLHLTLSAIIKFQGETRSRSIRTFDRVIFVKVSLGKRISSFIGKN